jgi:pimeloyl-ACP methyl ester carboxylesterase
VNLLAAAGLAGLALAAAGAIYQAVGSARDRRRFSPPGRLMDVGGHRLHGLCLGQGAPTVVLESGIAASSLSWAHVQPEVARFTAVCAYDRAGLAWSDAPAVPRTIDRLVEELHVLLTTLGCAAPHVMVGHSFGAFVCLAYADRHPERVVGLVLLDPPSGWIQMNRQQTRLLWGAVQLSRLGGVLARLGVVRACLALLTGGAPAVPRHFIKVFGPTTARTLDRLVGEVRKLPPEVYPAVQALWCQPKCFRAMADYLVALPDAARSVSTLRPPADLPLVVISSGDERSEVVARHRSLAQSSRRGRHITAANSHHWAQFDEPQLIVAVIRELVDAARRRRASGPPQDSPPFAGPPGTPS